METTLGGKRLGSGSGQKIHMKNYERSTHDLGYIFRSTMSSGTLVPFMSEVSLPGDTMEINLDCNVMTHPTIGPLFGSYKVQLDVFTVPIRLYQGMLHMNMLGIGMKMSKVKLPQIKIKGNRLRYTDDLDNAQINTSCLFSYLNIRGIGQGAGAIQNVERKFNAIPFLAYWDIYKNYYANKQEEIGVVIHNDLQEIDWSIVSFKINSIDLPAISEGLTTVFYGSETAAAEITISGTLTEIDPSRIRVSYGLGSVMKNLDEIFDTIEFDIGANVILCTNYIQATGWVNSRGYEFINDFNTNGTPSLTEFPLENIDDMKLRLLRAPEEIPYVISESARPPYGLILKNDEEKDRYSCMSNQEGLAIKTYQSDLFNNWLNTEWIDGAGGINEITAIDTTSGSITINELNLSKKIYDMLNRIAISGGSYDDWLDATYTQERVKNSENPIYVGGLSKELIFQEVVSNAATLDEPLGTLAGKGRLSQKSKGGYVKIKTDEPSYIIGIASITPRIDYSQGNKWDTNLKTMDDFHKPALDGIGFQDLMTEQMAYWSAIGSAENWGNPSAGKQPAWINYMTNVNVVRGNFANKAEQMYMTLNRKYDVAWEDGIPKIKDLTTYIDPSKYNHIFADTRLDAQNFWMQIKIDNTARRKMSAKVIPNL